MMKKYLLTGTFLLSVFGVFAQDMMNCGANIVLQQELQNPENRAKYEAFEEAMQRYVADPRVAVVRENDVRIIPVVFHILHDGGNENISMSKIQSQLDVMNRDFRRLNPDTVNTPERFYGDTEYTHFVFTNDALEGFVDDSAYIRLYNLAGENFAFHFNDGSGDLSDSLISNFDNVIEVNVSSNADTADLAMALASSINSQSGLAASYVYDGEHRVEVSTDGLGYVEDILHAGLWYVTSTITQQGTYLPADCKIEFRLATKDPLGNCTDGVVRVFSSKTNDANNGTGFKAESYWNAYSYLNIWSVRNFNLGQQGVIGFAQFPGSGLLSTDGIALVSGTIDGASSGGRAAMHEIGHWLSLIHIWGDAQCGSDNVLDTPTHNGPNGGVCGNLGSTLNTTPYNTPGCDPSNPDGEMFNNFMDYSSGACQNMFTLGQKERMDFTLEGDGNEPGIRSYMISQENLEATGVANPYTPSDCAPLSAFYFVQSGNFATQRMICAGEEVRFEEASYNGIVEDFFWTFEGGDPGTDDIDNPRVDYITPGIYDVTLKVSNAQGSDTRVSENMVIVSSTTAQYQSSWGYVDSFWDEQGFIDDYVVFNQDESNNKWEWYYGEDGGSTGWESVRMLNIGNDLGEIDELISPSYNLSAVNNPTIQFRYSGAALDNTPADELKIMASKNCGETWSSVATYSGFELINSGLVSGSYRPNANSVWTDVSETLSPSIRNSDNVRFKFRWTSGDRGNNFYIDDITIAGGPLGMEDLERQIDLSIAPNPTSNLTSVTMSLPDAAQIQMEIVDVLGRDARTILSRDMSNGTHKFDIDMSSYSTGVYYLRIFVDNDMIVKKVIKN